jgi:NADH-quinone oxidoreductase subunit N
VAQKSVKRMLAYSAIAHTGYLLIGIVAAVGSGPAATADPAGASGAVLFYLFPYALMTPGAFIVISYLGKGGGERETFADYRGLAVERPFVALALAVLMISFAGIPPTAGFWGKLYLFREAVAAGRWGLALVGIVTSVISAYYYLRLVVNMYMRGGGAERRPEGETRTASGFAVAFTALAVVLVGLFPEQLLRLSIALAQP